MNKIKDLLTKNTGINTGNNKGHKDGILDAKGDPKVPETREGSQGVTAQAGKNLSIHEGVNGDDGGLIAGTTTGIRGNETFQVGGSTDETVNIKKNSAIIHAEKAQKAAIMARNMSHNLGSHIMAYLKQQLFTVENILSRQDHVLYDIYDGTSNKNQDFANLQLPFLVGLGQFINYLQERQDYIATVATNYIPYPSPIDFKEAIFDGINPDLRWLRHYAPKNKKNKPFNILLNYIAKSEGYTRQPIEFGQKPSNEGRYLQINYVDYNLDNDKPIKIDGFGSKSMESAKGTNSISLAIPGGLIGRQAVFSIIENITRSRR